MQSSIRYNRNTLLKSFKPENQAKIGKHNTTPQAKSTPETQNPNLLFVPARTREQYYRYLLVHPQRTNYNVSDKKN